MQLLSDMKPAFLRLPGGNFLEGDTIADRFPWKKTIGPLEQRPGHRGCWRYGASDGMGLLEFMEWCEDQTDSITYSQLLPWCVPLCVPQSQKTPYWTASLACGNAAANPSATLRVWYSTNRPNPAATCVSVTWM